MNYMIGHDLGNVVYTQWLMHILTEDQWTRMFGQGQAVNEERSGDAVEICLAVLYFATLYPYEFRHWGNPYENYAGMETSLRSFASMTGYMETSKSQRSVPSAPLSPEVEEEANKIASVLGLPAVVDSIEAYETALKVMKHGPVDLVDVKVEDDDQLDQDMDVVTAEDEAQNQDLGDEETEEPIINFKKRKVGEMMGEILDMADTEGVCPVCWVNHPDQTCPRQGTMDALMKSFHHMANEGRDDDVTEQQTLQEDAAKEEEALDDDITLEVPLTMPDTTADKAIDVEMVDPNASKPAEDEAETEGEPTVFPGIRPKQKKMPAPPKSSDQPSSATASTSKVWWC